MRAKIVTMLLAATALWASASFSQTESKAGSLSEAERDGKKMFQQRCPVCHTSPLPGDKTYGPLLSADSVVGKEEAVREIIMKGTARMPGFQYGLQPKEIDDIIAYLKTVKSSGPGKAAPGKPQDGGGPQD